LIRDRRFGRLEEIRVRILISRDVATSRGTEKMAFRKGADAEVHGLRDGKDQQLLLTSVKVEPQGQLRKR
jgi:hypothetical protein